MKVEVIILAIGERIRFIRNLRGMTQKWLGTAVGFPEKTADVRLAQYEAGTRSPKSELTRELAKVLAVSPEALAVPNIDSYTGVAHTLFALEDIYGLRVGKVDGEIVLKLDKNMSSTYLNMFDILLAWNDVSKKFANGEISKDDYDQWRYNYPKPILSDENASTKVVGVPMNFDFGEEV